MDSQCQNHLESSRQFSKLIICWPFMRVFLFFFLFCFFLFFRFFCFFSEICGLIAQHLSLELSYATILNGFAMSKSSRIQSSILKIIVLLTVYERFMLHLLILVATNLRIFGPGPGSAVLDT